jgi:HD-GYP domain-containing protein (c-di-GMP phosphodiesterase class II)
VHKPVPLNDEELELMKQHPLYACVMIREIPYLINVLDIPYCHHENWDGSGYPRGIRGETIPLVARIITVIDTWDALISSRPYRKAWPKLKALHSIESKAGKKFSPEVVEAFIEWMRERVSIC